MNKRFKYIIRSNEGKVDLHLKETWEYRDLIILFVKKNFVALYKQTILGPLWAIIQPLLTTVVFSVVFGGFAKLSTSDISGNFILPGFLFYMSGNICFSYFSTTVLMTSNTFIANRATMGKVYYPRMVTPISTSLSNLINFGIQLGLFLLLLLYYIFFEETSISPKLDLLYLLPLTIVQMIILSMGCGIIISAMTTKYRDLAMLVTFILQLWQYASPVAYGLSLVPEKYLNLYVMVNPFTPIVTTFRYAFFGFGYFNIDTFLIGWGISILIFITGIYMFNKIEKTFMDTV